jgi:hypothetical protein
LGLEVTLQMFCKQGLQKIFSIAETKVLEDENIAAIVKLQQAYINTIDSVVHFLQGNNPTLAHSICKKGFLPQGSRFNVVDDLQDAFGNMGIQDKAKYFATMYLEDISDVIKATVDEHFGFSRYAERLGRSANTFDELYEALQQPLSFIDEITIDLLRQKIETHQPKMLALSVPFPGNLFASLRCAQFVQRNYPAIKVAMGGGFANTELRSVTDARVFEFFDFITLDDGEAPIENLIAYVLKRKTKDELKRTLLLEDEKVIYINNKDVKDYKQGEVGTPDYSDLLLNKYISAIEVANPMHRMWSDGRWNKLTMAHGCYWGKCTFCDISLDYIQRYEPVAATTIVDRMETIIAQTGENGFHFVDEAAPPSLMKAVAVEIIKRNLVVSWWTNIRFEKSFTKDLCLLLSASGCIAVSGGLEVASDRLLQLIDKGVTVSQVAKVARNFTESGILVHAYLMYGYPTQTRQETVDSLEMVRQLFAANVLQSAFWHRFALTAHSPVGLHPKKYKVNITSEVGSFANNDVEYEEIDGIDHSEFDYGLKKSLFNYMHQVGLNEPLQKWFEQKIPKTTIANNFIVDALLENELTQFGGNHKVIFIGYTPTFEYTTKSKKGNTWQVCNASFVSKQSKTTVQFTDAQGKWLQIILPTLALNTSTTTTIAALKANYEQYVGDDFELFWDAKPMQQLKAFGLLTI